MTKRICRRCSQFDPRNNICNVTFVISGEDYVLAVQPDDPCILEKKGLLQDVKAVRVWSDGQHGYIEYQGDSDANAKTKKT